MKRFGMCVLAMAFVVGAASMAVACEKDCKSAKVASAKGGCSKTAAMTASAKGGCDKSKGEARTASAKGGCDKSKCSKSEATTASAEGGCSKGKAQTASAKGGCDKSKCSKGTAMTASAKGDCSKKGCPKEIDAGVAAIMASMPHMTYEIDGTETSCCKTAKVAAASGKTVKYIVGDESYTCKQTAMNKLAEHMHSELSKFTTVSYVVGDKMTHCPNEARATAAQKGVEKHVMLAGVEFDNESKAKAVAAQLSAKLKEMHEGCSKSASGCAKTASASKRRCSKSAKTASAASSGCCKDKAKTASAGKSGCCKDKAATASTQVASAESTDEETPALANARQMVREIVEFVAAAKAS